MSKKSAQLQIRVTPAQKAALKRLARAAGMDVSSFVLARALSEQRGRFAELLRSLRRGEEPRYVLAELNDFLSRLAPAPFVDAVREADVGGLDPFLKNYVAAMVEHAAALKNVGAPPWVHDIEPLDDPWFAAPLRQVRPYLLRVAPVAFKRRNLFVDATIGDRV